MRTFPLSRLAEILFAIPWIVFGIQHYMYADFVRGLVPAYMPAHLFWVYLTGTAMLAAGVSFLIHKQVRLAAFQLACMLLLFILMLHSLLLTAEPAVGIHWTRFLQDTAIMGAALALARPPSPKTAALARYCYALPMLVLGAQHFTHNAFVTARVPDWFPAIDVFDYVIGLILIATAIGMLFTVNTERTDPYMAASLPGASAHRAIEARTITGRTIAARTSIALGIFLSLMFLLRHVPLLVKDPHNGFEWTGSMLDLALAAGAVIISACTLPRRRSAGLASASIVPV